MKLMRPTLLRKKPKLRMKLKMPIYLSQKILNPPAFSIKIPMGMIHPRPP